MKYYWVIALILIILQHSSLGSALQPQEVVELACAPRGTICVAYTRDGTVWLTTDLSDWKQVARLELWYEVEVEADTEQASDETNVPVQVRVTDVRLAVNSRGQWALQGGGELFWGGAQKGVPYSIISQKASGLLVDERGDTWMSQRRHLSRFSRTNKKRTIVLGRSGPIESLAFFPGTDDLLFTDNLGIWWAVLSEDRNSCVIDPILKAPQVTLARVESTASSSLHFVMGGRLKQLTEESKIHDLGSVPPSCDRMANDHDDIYLRCAGRWFEKSGLRLTPTDLLAVTSTAEGGALFSREGGIEYMGESQQQVSPPPRLPPFDALLAMQLTAFEQEIPTPPCDTTATSLMPTIKLYFSAMRYDVQTRPVEPQDYDTYERLWLRGGVTLSWSFKARWSYQCAPEWRRWERFRTRRSQKIRNLYNDYRRALLQVDNARSLKRAIAAHFRAKRLKELLELSTRKDIQEGHKP